jgi:adenylate cyclase
MMPAFLNGIPSIQFGFRMQEEVESVQFPMAPKHSYREGTPLNGDGENGSSEIGNALRHPIKVEIERKFLLLNDGWRKHAIDRSIVRDGLILSASGSKVRIRIVGSKATIAVKGERRRSIRTEYEYSIPAGDAEHLLENCCSDGVVEKARYRVPYAGKLWEIDVFLKGAVGPDLAEIELTSEEEPFRKPPWLGAEVTDDPHFSRRAIMNRSRNKRARLRSCSAERQLWGYLLSTIKVVVASLAFAGAACWPATAHNEVDPLAKKEQNLVQTGGQGVIRPKVWDAAPILL